MLDPGGNEQEVAYIERISLAVVEKKTTIPILSNVLLHAEKGTLIHVRVPLAEVVRNQSHRT